MQPVQLFQLAIILFIAYYFLVEKESFVVTEPKKDRLCSQKAINDASLAYTFGSRKSEL
jgi:hypothetical protein